MSKSNQCHGDKKVKSIDWIENVFCQIANLKILFLYIDYFYLANEKKKNARYRKTAFLTSRWAATFFFARDDNPRLDKIFQRFDNLQHFYNVLTCNLFTNYESNWNGRRKLWFSSTDSQSGHFLRFDAGRFGRLYRPRRVHKKVQFGSWLSTLQRAMLREFFDIIRIKVGFYVKFILFTNILVLYKTSMQKKWICFSCKYILADYTGPLN